MQDESVNTIQETPNSQFRLFLLLMLLDFYHVCSSGLPPVIMHDILEGYLPYTVKLMLNNFIANAYLSLEQLNQMIENFDYGCMPRIVKKSPNYTPSLPLVSPPISDSPQNQSPPPPLNPTTSLASTYNNSPELLSLFGHALHAPYK